MGTFGGALEARDVNASGGRLVAEVRGEIERGDDRVLVIKRIHVVYRLKAPAAARETIDRVYGMHQRFCPVYRSLEAAIDITTALEVEVPDGAVGAA
jgi:uncharacterized OsmC-like protein